MHLWRDERGAVVTAELVIITTVLGLGLIAGLTELRNAVACELAELAGAIRAFDQSYAYHGLATQHAYTAGSAALEADEPGRQALTCLRVIRPDEPARPVYSAPP